MANALEISLDPATLLARARAKSVQAQGTLLELYRNYLTLLARLHMGPKLQGKLDAADIVQETFLEAHHDFSGFRGGSEVELLAWLRQILATTLAMAVRHYFGTQRRDLRLERALTAELDHFSQILDRGLVSSRPTCSSTCRGDLLAGAAKLQKI